LTIALTPSPIGAGVTAALAAVARPKANAALNIIVLTIICSFLADAAPYLLRVAADKATAAMNAA
jgi:hypothetical protein